MKSKLNWTPVKNMKLLLSLLSLGASLVLSACQSTESPESDPTALPIAQNVVLILADDLGYADVGYHGCKDIPTPNIDRLAQSGVYFTNGYVTASVCGPTRAGLISGRYQQSFGAQNNVGPRRINEHTPYGLPLEVPTLAERFKEMGFATACFGKWHLGGEVLFDQRLFPTNRGFDEFYGFLQGAARYEDVHNVERKYIRGTTVLDGEKDYYTEALGREALSFIDRHRDERFFLYLPFNAVHAPMQAAPKDLERMAHIEDPDRRKLAAMLVSMDDQIGKVLDSLEATGLSENTLVVFLSDNGGNPDDNFSLNLPLRGKKTQAYEGGIRIPFCMSWPGVIAPNGRRDEPISSLDIFPTVLTAVGGTVEDAWQLDGLNLRPYFDSDQSIPDRILYWKERNHRAIRQGDWKLVQHFDQPWELFNLRDDLSEQHDLATEARERVEALKSSYTEWDANNKPAFFGDDKSLPVHDERVPR
jgi:arylsulfatase A-like enzyme